MKRIALAGALAAGAALLSFPLAGVFAQQPPPGPPVALYYGSVQGASAGQGVAAIVISGNKSTTCGASRIIDSSGPVYALDLISESQTPGCGASGRTVQFYISPANPTAPGRMATESATIPSAFGAVERNLTPGLSLPTKRVGVYVATDGIPGQ
jgi:hypothetical protein